MLVVVVVTGVMALIAVPAYNDMFAASTKAKQKRNAQQIAEMSAELAAMDVAHVIPDSLGGVEATARYLREGITVHDGLFAGKVYALPGLSDEEISQSAKYLDVIYEAKELRLIFRETENP